MVWGGYARVSTLQQSYELALDSAIERLRSAGCERIYTDIESRGKNDRIGITQMLSDLEKDPELEGIKVARLDRLTASPTLFEQICSVVKTTGKQIIGLDETIDLSSVEGQFSAGLQVMFAKRELETIRLRSQRGHDNKRRFVRANASVPFGYCNRDGEYRFNLEPVLCVLDEEKELSRYDILLKIFDLFEETQSLTQTVNRIHDYLGIEVTRYRKRAKKKQIRGGVVQAGQKRSGRGQRNFIQFTVSGLRLLLRSPVLRGGIPYGTREFLGLDPSGKKKYGNKLPQSEWEIEWLSEDRIDIALSPQRAAVIDSILEQNSRTKRGVEWGTGSLQPLSGKLICGECGGPCKAQGLKRQPDGWRDRRYYQCRNYAEYKRAEKPPCTGSKMILDRTAELYIIQALIDHASALKDSIDPAPDLNTAEIQTLQSQLDGLKKLGSNPAIDEAIREISRKISQLKDSERVKHQNRALQKDELLRAFKSSRFWIKKKPEKLRELFRQFVDYAVLKDGSIIEVRLKL